MKDKYLGDGVWAVVESPIPKLKLYTKDFERNIKFSIYLDKAVLDNLKEFIRRWEGEDNENG